jgi:hypothetical protein
MEPLTPDWVVYLTFPPLAASKEQPQRVGNRFLMDDVANLVGVKPIELV